MGKSGEIPLHASLIVSNDEYAMLIRLCKAQFTSTQIASLIWVIVYEIRCNFYREM